MDQLLDSRGRVERFGAADVELGEDSGYSGSDGEVAPFLLLPTVTVVMAALCSSSIASVSNSSFVSSAVE